MPNKQAMVTLRRMAEHRLSNVYNWQHLTLLWYCIVEKTAYVERICAVSYDAFSRIETSCDKKF